MILLSLAWTLSIASLWTSVLGFSPILKEESVSVRYPKLLSNETIDCNCANISCDTVFWFRTISHTKEVQFIGKCNNANRETHGDGVDKTKFKLSKNGGLSTLRIHSVTQEDTGIYSCVVKDRKNSEMWRPGFHLLPGVSPPTVPPVTKSKPRVPCRCSEDNSQQDDCGSLILWPLVGIISTLALTLFCMLYYFSRLPKKCKHHFVKKR
ncbi:uncharacterized protein cd8b [Xyrichtys novacula]|uniref:Uncharacterized protein cd8b n=1 Tax=Xyrichtys novacula TaxID=13765 RepID=A0AAV1ESE0_XYRNO|nr:uncharacterized protein cd8b [Xyrichtys novacula]